MDDGMKKIADAGVAGEGAGENPRGDRGKERDEKIISEGRGGVDAAEFVVSDIDRPGEKPEQRESEKARGEGLADGVVSSARKEDGGECGAGRAEGGNVFAAIRADAEMPG